MWRALKKARGVVHVCTYDNFKRNYMYILKKRGSSRRLEGSPSPVSPIGMRGDTTASYPGGRP